MLYINTETIDNIKFNWNDTIDTISKAVHVLKNNEFAQPIKPYLRYKDPINRIIAMPAYIGDTINTAGIKWIASFPNNIKKGIPRANCAVILNNAETGQIEAMFNTQMVSVIRTASVSGLLIKHYLRNFDKDKLTIGIIGWGPIGQSHYKMCKEQLGDKLVGANIFDIRKIPQDKILDENIIVCKSWEEVYFNSDIVITCTVSDKPYIDKKPVPGTLLINVSLRDYTNDVYKYVKNSIIVDNWEEVCRESTDIERLHNEMGLEKSMTHDIVDVVCNEQLKEYTQKDNIMFNPMGMAVFDIAISDYFRRLAKNLNVGIEL